MFVHVMCYYLNRCIPFVFILSTSSEIPGAVSQVLRGYDTRKPMFDHAFPNTKNKKQKWHLHNLLRVVEGLFAIVAAFITIMQETTVRNVLLSFSTLQAITNLDNIAYRLCLQGFLGMNARAGAIHVIVAKYNYDAYKLPSETKFCGYGSRRVAYLDGKLRYLIMLLFVVCAWLSTSIIVINQSKGNYRCSQKIIDEDYYATVGNYCTNHTSSQDNSKWKEKLPEGGDRTMSDVPLVVAVAGKRNVRISWTIRDPNTMKTIYPNSAYGNTTLIRGTGKFVDGIYLYYTCIPRNISGVWTIGGRRGDLSDETESELFGSRSGIYKLKSGVSIDGKEGGKEICVDDAKVGKNITQSHVIGNSCQHDITSRDGKCKEEYNTTECAYDGLRCSPPVQVQNNIEVSNNNLEVEVPDDEEDGAIINSNATSPAAEEETTVSNVAAAPKPTEVTDIVNDTITIVEDALVDKLP